jgi:quercetin 2,3-dioxygenase
MITLRRANDRLHERRRKQESWLTFDSEDDASPFAKGFGALELMKERLLPPRAGIRQPRRSAEIITYVRDGSLAFEDSRGTSGIIGAGEFQRMTAGEGIRFIEINASPTEWAHVFQMWLRPAEGGLELEHEQRRFSLAERRGALCLVASPDARRGSLRVRQDAFLYSSILEPGQHVVHELTAGRSAWLHIVQGTATLGTLPLRAGDGAGITGERAASVTAVDGAELLLLDIEHPADSSVEILTMSERRQEDPSGVLLR